GVVAAAAAAVSRLPGWRARSMLEPLVAAYAGTLGSAEQGARRRAAEALVLIQHRLARSALSGLLGDPHPVLRRLARLSLRSTDFGPRPRRSGERAGRRRLRPGRTHLKRRGPFRDRRGPRQLGGGGL